MKMCSKVLANLDPGPRLTTSVGQSWLKTYALLDGGEIKSQKKKMWLVTALRGLTISSGNEVVDIL